MCEKENEKNEKAEEKCCGSAEKIENIKKKIETLRKDFLDCVLAVVPSDVVTHLGNSKKELLLAAKSLLEKEIEKVDSTIKDINDKK